MKGGEASMLHIIVWNGVVTHVYKLYENPHTPATRLEEEFDYKVEYHDTRIQPQIEDIDKIFWDSQNSEVEEVLF